MLIKTLLLVFLIKTVINEPETYSIGVVFDEDTNDGEIIQQAIEQINSRQDNPDIILSAIIKTINQHDPYEALTATCSLLSEKTVAIFGPKFTDNINTVQSLCDNKEIPHIITQYNYQPLMYDHTIINFHPHGPTLSRAYFEIIQALGWRSFTLFYEDNDSLLRMAELIRLSKRQFGVIVKQLDEYNDGIYRKSLREARISGQRNFVIDCKLENLEEVLLQAQQIGLMTHHYSFLITNLDFNTINLAPIQYSEANITGIRIINQQNLQMNEIIDDGNSVKSQTAFLLDALEMFVNALRWIPKFPNSILDEIGCNQSNSLIFGTSLINLIKSSEYSGLTGVTSFDIEGYRSAFELDLIQLKDRGVEIIGKWDTKNGLNLMPVKSVEIDNDPESLRNRTFIVITTLTDPYGMLKETEKPLYGNDRFEGFGIDLIEELSKMEGFNYTFIIRHDKKNGNKDPNTGKWSGMIGDLMEYRADLAITDLTITSAREEAVDFTTPFMNLGISILARKPRKAPPSFFSFADPLALDVWIMLSLAYAVVSLSLYIVGRICPDEWQNPYPCIEEPEYLVNQFTFANSGWFTIGSLMQQGTEIAPIAIATRMIAGMWWFFVLIMVSSYTANLAASLTSESPTYLFEDIKSLVENEQLYKLRYGAKAGGATASFFKDSDNEIYKKVAQHMEEHPEDMVKENRDGVLLAEETDYAFFMESTSIEYETQRHCDLQQYGDQLDDKGYGIAMRKNSTYRKRLSTAVLKLQANGIIDQLKRKWWAEKRGGGMCSSEEATSEATPLNLPNVKGVFIVTVSGVIGSIFLVILEMLINTIQISLKTKMPFKETLKSEIKAYLNFGKNTKAVIGSNSNSKSGSKSDSKSGSNKINGCLTTTTTATTPEPYGFKYTVRKNDDES